MASAITHAWSLTTKYIAIHSLYRKMQGLEAGLCTDKAVGLIRLITNRWRPEEFALAKCTPTQLHSVLLYMLSIGRSGHVTTIACIPGPECMYICTHLCIHVCMYVCMYV